MNTTTWPWLAWLSGLSTSLQTQGSPVQFPVKAHAWVVGQAPSRGCVRDKHTPMFLSNDAGSRQFSSPQFPREVNQGPWG